MTEKGLHIKHIGVKNACIMRGYVLRDIFVPKVASYIGVNMLA